MMPQEGGRVSPSIARSTRGQRDGCHRVPHGQSAASHLQCCIPGVPTAQRLFHEILLPMSCIN